MKNEIDSKFVLSVFEKMRQHGEKQDEKYVLGGLEAFTDFDGYTLFIEDALVKLRFGFHNQYDFEYAKEEHFEQFMKKMSAIEQNY
jgi:hypothetical protein